MDVGIIPDEKIPLNGRTVCPPAEEGHPAGAAWRYGMLAVLLALLGNYIHWRFNVPPGYPYDRYSNGIMVTCLLLQHLRSSFRWPRRTRMLLTLVAHGMLLFCIVWVGYLSKRVYG